MIFRISSVSNKVFDEDTRAREELRERNRSRKMTTSVSTRMSDLRSRERLIWGQNGEEYLRKSVILILGFSVLTSELAISLVLTGIGEIVLVDDQITSEEDCGTCFTLCGDEILGKPKIHVLRDYLVGLGISLDLKVTCILQSPEKFLDSLKVKSSSFGFFEFEVAVCCNLSGKFVEEVLEVAKKGLIFTSPFVIDLKSRGFLGKYQIFSTESKFITFDLSNESKNLAKLKGLQLYRPLDSLEELSREINIKEARESDLEDYLSMIPFPLILLYAGKSVGLFGDEVKSSSQQNLRDKVRDFLKNLKIEKDCQNVDEAIRHQNLIFLDPKEVFSDLGFCSDSLDEYGVDKAAKACLPSSCSKVVRNYWLVLGQIFEFLGKHGRLPVNGEIPEMYCDTISFLQLQEIYAKQFLNDSNEILDSDLGESDITREFVQFVCKNIYCLRFTEFSNSFIRKNLWQDPTHPYSNFKDKFLKVLEEDLDFPIGDNIGAQDSQLVEILILDFLDNVAALKSHSPDNNLQEAFRGYLKVLGLDETIKVQIEDYSQCFEFREEFVTSSYISGVCSQEIVKLVLGRFVPLNNLLIWK
ncbi:NEDD8-activating enzyme E1 regulatory subunit [Cryptosporidium felis]|nr:NEDD8-activating enzyme E1 regulatory subunit [Cryptosporidium felis]